MQVREKLEQNDYDALVGDFIDVDSLENILSDLGFEKADYGNSESIWYENIAENINGYIARLKAKKGDLSVECIVDSMSGDAMIVNVITNRGDEYV